MSICNMQEGNKIPELDGMIEYMEREKREQRQELYLW